MKKFIVAILLMMGTAANGLSAEPRLIDLQRAYDLSVMQSELLGEREQDIKAAKARYWQAIGNVLPSAKLVISESFENKKTYGSSYAFGTQTQRYFETKLHAKQPIFAGFREFTAASGYKSEVKSRQFTKARSQELLYLDVTQAFYDALAHQQDVAVLTDLVYVLEQRDGELRRRISLGKSRESEALQSRAELAETRILVEDAQGLAKNAMETLAFYTGVPADEMQLSDPQILPSGEQLQGYLGRLNERRDIKAADADKTFAEKRVNIVKGEYLPTAWVEGNWYPVKDPDSQKKWDVLLSLEMPFFEGGITTAKLREERANVRISELKLAELRRRADKETRLAFHDFMTALERKARVEEALKIADENYRVQKQDFNLHRSTNLDVLQALRKVFELKRRQVTADADIKISHVKLHVYSGGNVP